MKRGCLVLFLLVLCVQSVWAGRAKLDPIARNPYVSAVVVDAATGQVLFDDNAAAVVYPASVVKMMDMLIILERIEEGRVSEDEMVQVTQEAAAMGGSQVYLDPKEQFSIEDLLYALTVQSANDAAVALASHVAGSTSNFVALMNKRALELGMNNTEFHSVHGLPPATGQMVDKTTAYDLSLLARELAQKSQIFKYTATREREFRQGEFMLRTHNHLLDEVVGCDGFKTGYFRAAGFSIVATAIRDGVRVIAIVMGSQDRKVRDQKAAELLADGFALVKSPAVVAEKKSPADLTDNRQGAKVEQATVTADSAGAPIPVSSPEMVADGEEDTEDCSSGWGMFFFGLLVGCISTVILFVYVKNRRSRRQSDYRNYR